MFVALDVLLAIDLLLVVLRSNGRYHWRWPDDCGAAGILASCLRLKLKLKLK